MGCKAAETIRNINTTFGPGTANKPTVQLWFKFCKKDKNLEDKEYSGQASQVKNNQWKAIIEADPLTTTLEVAKELSINHFTIVWHFEANWKGEKA